MGVRGHWEVVSYLILLGLLFSYCAEVIRGQGPLIKSLVTNDCWGPLFGHCLGILGVRGS